MKTTHHIHVGNIQDLEPGDRVHFHASDDHRKDWYGPRDFDATVARTILHSRFGPRIVTVEGIADGESGTENDFYLDDEWVITLIDKQASTKSNGPIESTTATSESTTAIDVKSLLQLVEGERDGYLASPNLDPAWVAGWCAAVSHIAHRLRGELTSPRDTQPDDTEINELITQSDCLGEALFNIAEKYGADVTNNEPRWQNGVYLREVGTFIIDVQRAVIRHKDDLFRKGTSA